MSAGSNHGDAAGRRPAALAARAELPASPSARGARWVALWAQSPHQGAPTASPPSHPPPRARCHTPPALAAAAATMSSAHWSGRWWAMTTRSRTTTSAATAPPGPPRGATRHQQWGASPTPHSTQRSTLRCPPRCGQAHAGQPWVFWGQRRGGVPSAGAGCKALFAGGCCGALRAASGAGILTFCSRERPRTGAGTWSGKP